MESSLEFYSHRIANFEEEKKVVAFYEGLISAASIDSGLLYNEQSRERELIQSRRIELNKILGDITRIELESSQAREEIDRLKSDRINTMLQINNLKGLGMPVKSDTTYFFVDRYVSRKNIKNEAKSTINVKGASKQLRSGDIVQLEQIVDDIVKRTANLINSCDLVCQSCLICDNVPQTSNSVASAQRTIDDIKNLDAQCVVTVTELLGLRLKIITNQRELVDNRERLRLEREYCREREGELSLYSRLDIELMQRRVNEELHSSQKDFERQLFALNDRVEVLKTKETGYLSSTDGAQAVKVKNSVLRAKERLTHLRRRNQLEIEGFENEIGFLRRKLKQLQRLHKAHSRQRIEKYQL